MPLHTIYVYYYKKIIYLLLLLKKMKAKNEDERGIGKVPGTSWWPSSLAVLAKEER